MNIDNAKILLDRPGVKEVFEKFEKAGFEIYIVGGAIRDAILGFPIDDIDFTTNATPEQIADLFDFSLTVGAKFGTVQAFEGDHRFEITTYRSEGAYLDGRHPSEVVFGTDLLEDLKRRDFTINGLVMDSKGNVLDYVGGVQDLEDGVIRTIGNPSKRFSEDKLRKWRCVRFAAEKSFELDLETHRSLVYDPDVDGISLERIRDELNRLLLSDKVNWGGYLLVRTNLYPMLLRRIAPGMLERLDEWQDLVEPFEMMRALPPEIPLRLAALLIRSDPVQAGEFLRKLKYPNKTIKETMMYLKSFRTSHSDGVVAYKKMAGLLGREKLANLCALQEAAAMVYQDRARIEEMKKTKEYAMGLVESQEPLRRDELDINGRDIEDMGFRGKEISECFDYLLERVYLDPSLNTKSQLTELLKEMRSKNESDITEDN